MGVISTCTRFILSVMTERIYPRIIDVPEAVFEGDPKNIWRQPGLISLWFEKPLRVELTELCVRVLKQSKTPSGLDIRPIDLKITPQRLTICVLRPRKLNAMTRSFGSPESALSELRKLGLNEYVFIYVATYVDWEMCSADGTLNEIQGQSGLVVRGFEPWCVYINERIGLPSSIGEGDFTDLAGVSRRRKGTNARQPDKVVKSGILSVGRRK